MAKEKKEDFKSDWAYSKKHEKNIHISEAESGLKGYRCLGCHSQMVANIQKKNPNWLSYFSHYASDVNKEKVECVRASKTYREKIARSILNELKYVNAPAIYKYPPLGSDENLFPMKIESRKKIEADYTKAELSFYENEDGAIKWGKNLTITAKYLLIRPDVTFFNKDNKPILFIEFIVYNKIKPDKFLKLSRLGIDTLQINIPRKSEAEIEKALKSSRTYKWVYNEEEANTNYISVSRTNSEELSQINDNERIVFEEDFRCRQAEINQLIRSLKKSLSSEQYRTIEFGLNQQIQKVARNTESANQRLGDLEESNRRDALARNQNEEDQEDNEYTDLEKRYLGKKDEFEEAISLESVNQRDRKGIIDAIQGEKEEIGRIEREEIDFEAEIRERAKDKFREQIESLDAEIEKVGKEDRELKDKVFSEFSTKINLEESEINRIRKEEGNIEESAGKEFDREIKNNTRELPEGIRELLDGEKLVYNYKEAECKEKSYISARKFLGKRTWEKE
jgi:hypothetical protein